MHIGQQLYAGAEQPGGQRNSTSSLDALQVLAEEVGRKKLYNTSKELADECWDYFQWVEDNPLQEMKVFANGISKAVPKMRAMTVGGLCLHLGISKETWYQYSKQEDFSDITTRAMEIMRTQKFEGAAANMLNPNIIARDLALAKRREVVDESPLLVDQTSDRQVARAILSILGSAVATNHEQQQMKSDRRQSRDGHGRERSSPPSNGSIVSDLPN